MKRPPPAGFSLVLSLIILTLLAILVVGFLSSATFDRTTARAFASKTRAELAAESGVNQAISLLAEKIALFPDSATVWEALTPAGGGEVVEGTMLYYYDAPPGDPKNPNPTRRILPLMSLGTNSTGDLLGEVPVPDKATVLGADPWTDDNSIDLNRPRFNGDTAGWIGSPPPDPASGTTSTAKPKPFRAKWIDVKEPGVAASSAKTVARYAFWIEDESFKLNLNLLGATPRGSETTSPGRLPSEVPIQGLLRSARAPFVTDPERDTFADNVLKIRDAFFGKRLLEMRGFNQAHGSYNLGDETKFLATTFSGGLNLSRHGSQRLNLNGLGFDIATTSTTPTDDEINKSIARVVETIRFHAPKFGQRFYRDVSAYSANPAILNAEQVTPAHQDIYLYKIAANLRDYIDPDFQPTVLQSGGTLLPRKEPVTAMSSEEGDNEIWAQGKDSAPFLQEAVARLRGGPVAPLRYELKVDYYLEFWNMTGRDVAASELGTNPFVRVSNAPAWLEQKSSGLGGRLTADNSPPGIPDDGRTLTVYLKSAEGRPVRRNGAVVPEVIFKAGACTVVTTDPDVAGANAMAPLQGGTNSETTYCSENISGKREFSGPVQPPKGSVSTIGIIMEFNRDTPTTDYRTEVVLGNEEGYLDSHPAAVAYSPRSGLKAANSEQVHGGSLYGNENDVSQLGDPRTNSEQLNIKIYQTGGMAGEPDQTRYANPLDTYPRFSLGYPNSRFVFPHEGHQWRDYYKGWEKTGKGVAPAPNPTPENAPAFVANAPMKSTGELGHLFDPSRIRSGKGTLGKIEGSRGGGRTLKIGQPDDLINLLTISSSTTDGKMDASAVNRSRQWAAWRLCDFLTTTSDINLAGQININGLRRDNGAALRAACYGLSLQTVARAPKAASVKSAISQLSSEENATIGLQQIITQALERMNRNDPARTYNAGEAYFGPFVERGELSELPIFNNGNNHAAIERPLINEPSGNAVNMADAIDRSREELFRRLVDMTTTRGSVFSVYVVGQSIVQSPGSNVQRVTGTHQVKVTFQLVPKKANGADFQHVGKNADGASKPESFDPGKVGERFERPDHYDIQILQIAS